MKTEEMAEFLLIIRAMPIVWLWIWNKIQELNLSVGLKQETIDEVQKVIQKMIDESESNI